MSVGRPYGGLSRVPDPDPRRRRLFDAILQMAPVIDALNTLGNSTNGVGILVVTGPGAVSSATLQASGAGLAVTNGSGTAGNVIIQTANDLAAIEALNSTGIVVRSSAETWVTREIVGTANQINVSSGSGTGGNVVLSTPQDLHTAANMTIGSLISGGGILIGSGTLSLSDGVSVATGSSAGTMVGTDVSQKLGFFGAAPVVQPADADQADITPITDSGTIAALTFSEPPTQAECEALRDALATVASDFTSAALLLKAMRNKDVSLGLMKGSA